MNYKRFLIYSFKIFFGYAFYVSVLLDCLRDDLVVFVIYFLVI